MPDRHSLTRDQLAALANIEAMPVDAGSRRIAAAESMAGAILPQPEPELAASAGESR